MAADDSVREVAPLPPPPPARRLAAWLYTGPLGHLWATGADVVVLWGKWGWSVLRARVSDYSNR
jgi:hypothetical protein